MGLEGGLSALVSMSGSISETGGGGADVSYNEVVESGTLLGVLTIDDHNYGIYAPEGGTDVSYDPELQSGTLIGTLTIDEVEYPIYAPSGGGGGGSTVSYTATVLSGTLLGTLTIDNVNYPIYAPEDTDTKVTQNTSTADTDYNVLLSYGTDPTTNTVNMNSDLTYNPHDKMLTVTNIKTDDIKCDYTLQNKYWRTNINNAGISVREYENGIETVGGSLVVGGVSFHDDSTGESSHLEPNELEISDGSDTLTIECDDIVLDGTSNTWDGTNTSLKDAIAASGGGGGSVTITPSFNRGLKIADYTIGNTSGSLYVPMEMIRNVNQTNVRELFYTPIQDKYYFTLASSNGYEGVTYIIMYSFIPGNDYKISFYFTNTASGSFQNYPWRCAVENTLVTNYNVAIGESNLPKTLSRELVELTFTASQETYYLVFYLASMTTSGLYQEIIDTLTIEDITAA